MKTNKTEQSEKNLQVLEIGQDGRIQAVSLGRPAAFPAQEGTLSPPPCSCDDEIACCGLPAPPRSGNEEKPGYKIQPFVEEFITASGKSVPKVRSRLKTLDRLGSAAARLGLTRNDYRIAPGLYCLGKPDSQSNVLVTANYKLTFDSLRKELGGLDLWVLVVDARGINVWCAAGKGTFSAEEVIYGVRSSGLDSIVEHRRLILPQLSAPGVNARDVKKGCGFEVIWGPVRAGDLPAFLRRGLKAEPEERRVTFTFQERVVLIPVEIHLTIKPFLWMLGIMFIISGIGESVFSFSQAWDRWAAAAAAGAGGVMGGAVLAPLLLPWIRPRAFSAKGLITGLICGIFAAIVFNPGGLMGGAAMVLLCASISSYLAMNFTGATPFTSPSGVEKEMRRAVPVQAVSVVIATALWIAAGFTV